MAEGAPSTGYSVPVGPFTGTITGQGFVRLGPVQGSFGAALRSVSESARLTGITTKNDIAATENSLKLMGAHRARWPRRRFLLTLVGVAVVSFVALLSALWPWQEPACSRAIPYEVLQF